MLEFRGPPVVRNNTLGVHGNSFDFLGSTKQKRLKTTDVRVPQRNLSQLNERSIL